MPEKLLSKINTAANQWADQNLEELNYARDYVQQLPWKDPRDLPIKALAIYGFAGVGLLCLLGVGGPVLLAKVTGGRQV